jgi:hypothetical protein
LASATTVLAGESIIYVTDEITITSCHSTVTNCPARSTVYVFLESKVWDWRVNIALNCGGQACSPV